MTPKFARAVPQLPVRNVSAAQAHYRDVFGFAIDWSWGDDYGAVSLDETTIYLSAVTGPFTPVCLVISTTEVDALCVWWKTKGANIFSPPEDKPWGLREFTACDLDGHCLRISRLSQASEHVARPRLDDVRIVPRLPTETEYDELVRSVGWESFANLDAARHSVPQSLFSVVAEYEGRCVGLSRVIGDGALFYYIMDVVVHPDLQGRGIGTALMNQIVDFIVRTAPEKALIGLFTSARRSGFYARFGFMGPETWLYGMSAIRLRRVES